MVLQSTHIQNLEELAWLEEYEGGLNLLFGDFRESFSTTGQDYLQSLADKLESTTEQTRRTWNALFQLCVSVKKGHLQIEELANNEVFKSESETEILSKFLKEIQGFDKFVEFEDRSRRHFTKGTLDSAEFRIDIQIGQKTSLKEGAVTAQGVFDIVGTKHTLVMEPKIIDKMVQELQAVAHAMDSSRRFRKKLAN